MRGEPIGSASLGHYVQRVRRVSPIDYNVGSWRGSIEGKSQSIEIDDTDGWLKSLTRQYGGRLEGSPIWTKWASPALAPADWIPIFTGIYDSVTQSAAAVRTINARTDDAALQRRLNLPILNSYTAVRAGASGAKAFPVVYGIHDSTALSGTTDGTVGALPCLYLGEYPASGFRYLVSAGPMFHVARVYNDGVLVAPANWQRLNVILSGMVCTVVSFATLQGTVTVDGIGIHADAFGQSSPTTAPFTNGVEILRHALANFAYQGWRGQAWKSESDIPLDIPAADAAQAYVDRQGYPSSLRLGGESTMTGAGLIAAVCRDNGLRAEWTPEGLIALRYQDHAETDIYRTGERWFRRAPDSLQEIQRSSPNRDRVDGIAREYWRVESAGAARSTVTILRPGAPAITIDTHQSASGEARRLMDRALLPNDTSKMALSAYNIGKVTSGAGMKDGAAVAEWNDTGYNRTLYPVTQGTAANRPTLRMGRLNARPVVTFDGSNDVLTGTVLSNLMTVAEFTFITVFRVQSASANNAAATVFNNHPIVGDSNGYFGLYVRTAAGVYYLQAALFDSAQRVVETPILLDTWYIAAVSHFGGVLTLSLQPGFSGVSIAAGNIGAMGGVVCVGGNTIAPVPFSGDIAEVLWFGSGDIAAQGATAGFLGGGAMFEICKTLKREYAI